ncbi:putative membrane protein [Bacteroides fragilis str. 3986 T(B)9]|uniref:Membrane protein n=4 Tax=Bacteroides fragilis TaxID=817 RepID=Q5L8S2_BACFN|nr:putative membrane protein [Bacteroides fragilis str. 1007-1-F \
MIHRIDIYFSGKRIGLFYSLFYLLLIFKNIIVLLRNGFIELILFFILDYI